jgi:hypothetical protein
MEFSRFGNFKKNPKRNHFIGEFRESAEKVNFIIIVPYEFSTVYSSVSQNILLNFLAVIVLTHKKHIPALTSC